MGQEYLRSIQILKNLNKDERAVAKKVVQRNAFFYHPDLLLLAMCADDDAGVRAKAARLVKGIRQQEQNTKEPDSESDNIEVNDELIQYTDDESEDMKSWLSWKSPSRFQNGPTTLKEGFRLLLRPALFSQIK